ncbi:MAG: RNA polymerase sigma factor [Bacteroidales bacterium]|nr:RNA polymerase sigma factor [Bacteroidales bacterium]MDZ4203558.1 RNA polymerase sigma factor [Bacteroidales bacterium]
MTAIEFNNQLISLHNSLKYFANTLTGNTEAANDLIQDTYLKALLNRDKFAHDTNLKAWTYTIMKNTFINNYRRSVKANTIVDSTKDLFYINFHRPEHQYTPEGVLATKEINASILKLDKEQRLPFEMHTAGYKYKEIAEELNLSIGTVKSRIFFTRKKLMDALKEYQN